MYNIAIDGPAGAGKSTIAKLISKKLGFIYVDTGALYRAIALYFLSKNIKAENKEEVLKELDKIDIKIKYSDKGQLVILNDADVTDMLRQEEVGKAASTISVYKEVREKLLDLQRNLAKENNVVMDGRDIASFVLPKADLKIYLTASVHTRAKRRFEELKQKDIEADLEKIKEDIETRDYRDMHREFAPLKKVSEAVLIDSSNFSIQEVTNMIIDLYNKSL